MRARIAGVGHFVPGNPISNEDLIAMHNIRVKPFFIRQSVGAQWRHFADASQATSDLAAAAAMNALESSGLARSDIRRIILATVSGDYPTPATACIVQRKLGMRGVAAIDIVGACSGFSQALDLGARCVATGEGPVLVIGADIRSRQLNFADLRTVFLYGDGAGAVVLTPASGNAGIHHSILMADGEGAEAVLIPAGGSREPISVAGIESARNTITMSNGRLVAAAARKGLRDLVARLLAESPLTLADFSLFCLHQPNLFLARQLLADISVPQEKSWVNFHRYGNTTSATVPIALSEAVAAGKVRPHDWICLAAVGAGYAGGIQAIRWGEE